MSVALLQSPPPWHEIMDCVLSLAVGTALADVTPLEKRNVMKPLTGDTLIGGQLDHAEVEVMRELFGTLCAHPTHSATVNEKMAAFAINNRHPGAVCKYLSVACSDQQKIALVSALVRVALADGEMNASEAWFIERSSYVMEVPEDALPELRSSGSIDPTECLGDRLANHCRVLEVAPPLDVPAIKKAYRGAAMKNHPDTVAASGQMSWADANERFIQVRRSYEALLIAAESGSLGPSAGTRSTSGAESLTGAAVSFWSGFSKVTWSSAPKSIQELLDERDARKPREAQHGPVRRPEPPARTESPARTMEGGTKEPSLLSGLLTGSATLFIGGLLALLCWMVITIVASAVFPAGVAGVISGFSFIGLGGLVVLVSVGAGIEAASPKTPEKKRSALNAGAPLCSSCQRALPSDALFCPKCGKKV